MEKLIGLKVNSPQKAQLILNTMLTMLLMSKKTARVIETLAEKGDLEEIKVVSRLMDNGITNGLATVLADNSEPMPEEEAKKAMEEAGVPVPGEEPTEEGFRVNAVGNC
jgi:hypothetical protein